MLGSISTAIAGLVKLPPGEATQQTLKFDGVWVGHGNITLIKQLDGYIILQGKDKVSTWWARGIINGNQVTCRGSGVTNNGMPFVYESSITFEGGILKDSWKAIFPEGKELQGDEKLKPVVVEVLQPTR